MNFLLTLFYVNLQLYWSNIGCECFQNLVNTTSTLTSSLFSVRLSPDGYCGYGEKGTWRWAIISSRYATCIFSYSIQVLFHLLLKSTELPICELPTAAWVVIPFLITLRIVNQTIETRLFQCQLGLIYKQLFMQSPKRLFCFPSSHFIVLMFFLFRLLISSRKACNLLCIRSMSRLPWCFMLE